MNTSRFTGRFLPLCLLLLHAIAGYAQITEKTALYLDVSKPVEERVLNLISILSLEEKAILLNHRGPLISRLNIRSDGWNQALHGVWWDRPTTMFPVSIAMAATWDTSLVHEVATATSDEARAIYNGWHNDSTFPGEKKGLMYRAPVINVSRNPYWGRINECYGEDPFLTGRMGVSYVKGLQGNDPKYLKLVATLKHFAVNNVERNRQALSAEVSERMLHEFWLPHFKDCIIEGNAQSVMASYNAINGVPNNINKLLLTTILKEQWGFKGFVVSDLGGVNSMVKGHEKGKMSFEDAVAQSLNAGCDFSDKEFMQYIPAAVKAGLLPEKRLDDALFRVLRDRFLLGEFDPASMVPYSKISPDVIGNAAHRQLALKLAQQSMVLLTNRNKTLPLDRKKIKTIAVIGPHADLFTAGGYSGKVTDPVTPLQGIKNRAGSGIEIIYAKGTTIISRKDSTEALVQETKRQFQQAVDVAKKADVVIVFAGTTLDVEAEGRDRNSLGLPGAQEQLIEAVMAANARTIVVEMNAGPLTVPVIKEKAAAMLEAWWAGEEGGNAIADILFGNVNPGGKLPLTVYADAAQVPSVDEYDVTKGFTYMYLNGKPLFPFGHGLSYTTFKYSDFKIPVKKISDKENFSVSVTVSNTGKVKGDEVAQLYVHDVVCSVKRPGKELRGFQRVTLNPGEKKTLTFIIPANKLAFYDEKTHGFIVEPGMFDIMIGSSSEDIRQNGQIEVVKK
ncbi:MAG: glycoside hydrolase family 3 C-terminal domain-containing protein [Chitinophagaceae bacterium]